MFFWAVPLNTKNGEEGHPRLFSRFWAQSCQKRLEAFFFVQHRNARPGERHQLVGHQVDEQVRHRAVQALAGADTTQHAGDVDVAPFVVGVCKDGEEVEVLRGSLHGL